MESKQLFSTYLYPPSLETPSLKLAIFNTSPSSTQPSSTPPLDSSSHFLSFQLEINDLQVQKEEGEALRKSVWAETVKVGLEEFKDFLGLDAVGDFSLSQATTNASLQLMLPLTLLPPYPTSSPPALLIQLTFYTSPKLASSDRHSLLQPSSTSPLHFLAKSLLASAVQRIVLFLAKEYPDHFSGDWKKRMQMNEEERKVIGESLTKVLGGVGDGSGFGGENGRKRDELILRLHQALRPSDNTASDHADATCCIDPLFRAQEHFSENLQSALYSLSKTVIKSGSISSGILMKSSRRRKEGFGEKVDEDTLEDFPEENDNQAEENDKELEYDVFDARGVMDSREADFDVEVAWVSE